MNNNKGFIVSSILYTLLVAFLLFLSVLLASLASSTSTIGNSNNDLINNAKFEAKQVRLMPKDGYKCIQHYKNNPDGTVTPFPKTDSKQYYWNEYSKDASENIILAEHKGIIVKINSRYGTMYWPKDFKSSDPKTENINREYKNIKVSCKSSGGPGPCSYANIKEDLKLIIEDTQTHVKIVDEDDPNISLKLYDICDGIEP